MSERDTGMPFCFRKRQINILQIPRRGRRFFLKLRKDRRVSLCISQKGSLTLETAFTLPFLLCAVTALLCIFAFTSVQAGNYRKLVEQAELLAVTTGTSCESDPYICLYDSTLLSSPFPALLPGGGTVVQKVSVRAWAGYTGETFSRSGSTEELVHITPDGTVCHKSRDCTHLRLSIQSLSAGGLETARNRSGGKYMPCEFCVKSTEMKASVYITDYGNSYHYDRSCQGLKRTVMAVPRSEAGGRPLCSRCGR